LNAWERTIPLLRERGHDVVGIWTCPAILASKRGVGVPAWYLQTFGLIDFAKLAAFAVLAKLARMRTGRPRSFASLAEKNAIQFQDVPSPNHSTFRDWLERERIDILLITVSFILGETVLAIPRLGTINKHAAALPANRGLFPYFCARLKGAPQGISYHLVSPSIDEGALLVQDRAIPRDALDTMVRFYLYVFRKFPERMCAAVEAVVAGDTSAPDPQIAGSYYGLPTRKDVRDFRRAGGSIVGWSDLSQALTL
jgi:methionyl-tRNA formyltransferase